MACSSSRRQRLASRGRVQRAPACGEKPDKAGDVSSRRNPPRVCGENVDKLVKRYPDGGSPPRVRGKRASGPRRGREKGITPAHAGKTELWSEFSVTCEDHPRACGKNQPLAYKLADAQGSPPRMRGKRHHVGCVRPEHGIIPACAGKTNAPLVYPDPPYRLYAPRSRAL